MIPNWKSPKITEWSCMRDCWSKEKGTRVRHNGKLLSKCELQWELTSGTVQAQASSHQQVPIPEQSPQQVSRTSWYLSHLLGHFNFFPAGPFWHTRVDTLSEPHLQGKGNISRSSSDTPLHLKRQIHTMLGGWAHSGIDNRASILTWLIIKLVTI